MSGHDAFRAGVAGWPVSHSKSPRLHGYWLEKYQINGRYDLVEVNEAEFPAKVRALQAEGWRGLNVTIPHKLAALRLADRATERAQAIGAANTLVFQENGEIFADNTDAYGFSENLRQETEGREFSGAAALMIGAGGAGRAIIYALREMGLARLTIVNRTISKAEALSTAFGGWPDVAPFEEVGKHLPEADLIINTTSLGMAGNPPLELPFSEAKPGALVTDIVYTPLMTPFLLSARDHGLSFADGLGMLLHQGRPGFHAWFGAEPEVDDNLREVMLAP